MTGCALLLALAWVDSAEADRRVEVARQSPAQTDDFFLLDYLSDGFVDAPKGGTTAALLPRDVRMLLFLLWLDDRGSELVATGQRKAVEEVRRQTAALHREQPRNLFALYLLALTERHLGRPEAAFELLELVPDRLCDPRAAVPPYQFLLPGGGEAERGSYLYALYTLHLDAFEASRETRSLGYFDRLGEMWRLLWAYTRATRCEPPVQRLHREHMLLRAAVVGNRASTLPEPVVRELAHAHPVWSAILPDSFFRLFALARWEETWRTAGRSSREDGAPIAPFAAWIAAAQQTYPGNLPAALFQAGCAEGRGRRSEALNALEAFWAQRAQPGDGRPLLLPHEYTPVPLGSLLVVASRHASLALHEEGVRAYLQQLMFYTLRGLETLPVAATLVPLVFLTLAALSVAHLTIRASFGLQRFGQRLEAVTFAWWNRRQDSRLRVDAAADFPQPDDTWQQRQEGERSCELAQVVAALAAAGDDLRREFVELLIETETPEWLPRRWEGALPPTTNGTGKAINRSQCLLQAFVALAPGSPAYWSGLLRDLSFAQFEEADRPIVELVSNAVDATRQRAAATGQEMQSIQVYFLGGSQWSDRPCEATVWDEGCGMSPESLLFDLLVPLTTTKEDSLATIGRFGVGFFSVLRYLARPDASVQVETADGQHCTRLGLTPPRRGSTTGSPEVTLQVAASTRLPFTRVVVQGGIARDDCKALLARTFRFLPSPPVEVAATRINNLAPYRRLDAGGGVQLLWRRLREPGPSSLSLVIRGETVGRPVELLLPEGRRFDLGLCLPATAAVALSRNLPVVDERLADAFQRAAAAARKLGFGGFTLLNLLAELSRRLHLHHREPRQRERLEAAIHQALQDLWQGGMVFLPLGPDMHRIDTRSVLMRSAPRQPCVFLHPVLFALEKARSLEPFRLAPGQPVYLLPFRESEDEVADLAEPVLSVQCSGLTFLDERLRPRTAAGRAVVDLLAHPHLPEIEVDDASQP